METYPYFGFENERPSTRMVVIGNDCWIGEGAAILKGTSIGDESIIGFGTLVAGKDIPARSRVIEKRTLTISQITD